MGTTVLEKVCVHKAFRAYVLIKNVRTARFLVDGRTVAVVRKAVSGPYLSAVIDPARYTPGAHVLTARVQFKNRKRSPRTVTLRFRRCDDCRSRRAFRIRVPNLRNGERAVRAKVYVNGRQVRVVTGRRLAAKVVLAGLPRGTYRVRIVAFTNRGRVHRSTRTYRTCVGKTRKPSKKRIG